MNLFNSTAEFYAAFRSDVPDSVASIVSSAAPDASPRRLLDVGTGTGFVVRAMLPHFDEVIGVDPDAELLASARKELAEPIDAGTVKLVQGSAEGFALAAGWQPQLITVCRAFHWFDRPRFLARAASVLAPGGTLAIFGDLSIWAANDDWKAATRDVLQDMLGKDRRAGEGTYAQPARDYVDDLEDAGFTQVARSTIPVHRTRTVDSVIGYLHSTSFASLAVLGDLADSFDDRIRERLTPLLDANGLLHDHNEFNIITATQ